MSNHAPGTTAPGPLPLVVMGPSGCGKSTLARMLAAALGWRFIEGDALHPPANHAKMAAGIPLTDADRAPFLQAVGDALAAARADGAVAACSALKRSYRDVLRARAGPMIFVWPRLAEEELRARLARRQGHFMPVSLLASQLADLEIPAADERAVVVDGHRPTEEQVALVLAAVEQLRLRPDQTST